MRSVSAAAAAYFRQISAPGGGHEFLVKSRLPPIISTAASEYDVRFCIAASFTPRPRTGPTLKQFMRDRAAQKRFVAPGDKDLHLGWPVGCGRDDDAVLGDPVNVEALAEHCAAPGVPVVQRAKELASGGHKLPFFLSQRHGNHRR